MQHNIYDAAIHLPDNRDVGCRYSRECPSHPAPPLHRARNGWASRSEDFDANVPSRTARTETTRHNQKNGTDGQKDGVQLLMRSPMEGRINLKK